MDQKTTGSILIADDLFADHASQKRAKLIGTIAVGLSKQLNKSIELVHVEELTNVMEGHNLDSAWVNQYLKTQQKCLDERMKSFPKNANGTLLTGRTIETFEKLTKDKKKYDFLVVGSHGYRGLQRMLLGSFAEEMLRRSRIPVLVVGPKVKGNSQNLTNKKKLKLLLALDLSDNGKNAEEFTVELSKQIPIEIQIYHSFMDGMHPIYQGMMSPQSPYLGIQTVYKSFKDNLMKALNKKHESFMNRGIRTTLNLDEKSFTATEGLVKAIKQFKPDLVVMGTRGRNLVSGAFLGNTARAVILESTVPVMVVNSKD